MQTYIKHFKPSKQHYYIIELAALQRARGCPGLQQLVDYDKENLTITTQFAGYDLTRYGIRNKKEIKRRRKSASTLEDLEINCSESEFVEQFVKIGSELDNIGVTHLDVLPKNICLLNGKITLIDFELCVLDHTPEIRWRSKYEEFLNCGGWNGVIERMVSNIRSKIDWC